MSFDIKSYYSDQANGKIILHYKGNIDSEVINNVLDTIEGKMVEVNERPRLKKKVYNVLVESLQNLFHHVDKVPDDFEEQNADKYGLVVVKKVDQGYKIITGNFIQSEHVSKLEEKIKKINKSSHDEIKEMYKYILNHQRISAKGGGGLGLVDIARKTGHKLGYEFKKYSQHYSFFYLDILVSEEN
jgi:hypothetical protein